jgi:phage-related protein
MADRHAAPPSSKPRIVGSAQQPDARPYCPSLFCEHEGKVVMLHAFIKKTQKTPASDLELAIRRKKEIV